MYHQKDNLGNYSVFKCMKDLYRKKKKKAEKRFYQSVGLKLVMGVSKKYFDLYINKNFPNNKHC